MSNTAIIAGTSVVVLGEREVIGIAGAPGPKGLDGTTGDVDIQRYAFSFGDATPATIITLARASQLAAVNLDIRTPFNGSSPAIRIGSDTVAEAYMAASENDPTWAAQYEVYPMLDLPVGAVIQLRITPGGATQGAGVITLTLIPT